MGSHDSVWMAACSAISINDDWSALRFRQQGEIKTLKRGTDYPGIDRTTKKVLLPQALKNRLEAQDLVNKFENLSFSRRRELVVAILEAKKPETIEKRINSILELLVE